MALQVCAFANATCGSFVAITQTGYLQVSVQNTGYIASSYTVEVQVPFQHEPRLEHLLLLGLSIISQPPDCNC